MHDVLDLRDTIPDEAEQRLHSGYAIGTLLEEAGAAAAASDLVRLETIGRALEATRLRLDWPYHEPSDEQTLVGPLRDVPVLPVDASTLFSRIHGAWLGRCVGNTMGKPIEGLTRSEVEAYLRAAGQWPQTGYVPLLDVLPEGVSHLHWSASFSAAGRFENVPVDDDLDWTILGLSMVETYGDGLSTEDIAQEWLQRMPFKQTYTAERIAYRNLIRGTGVAGAARTDNPYREWIGALIRGDVFGYINPGDPGRAATAAFVDARLTHLANGIYGELWSAALVAAAFGTSEPRVALELAQACIPSTSRLFEVITKILDLHAKDAAADEALAWVDEALGHYNWVHTINNAALIAIGLLWGRDFTHAVALTISGARDTDSNAATVGSVYGALYGVAAIPQELVGDTHHRVNSSVVGFDRIPIRELAERTFRLARAGEKPATAAQPRAPIPIILDTDPGLGEPGSDIDDGFAIALALRSPELDVVGITTVNGNVDLATGTDVARRLCQRLGRPDLPVVAGAASPLKRSMAPLHAMFEAVFERNPALRRAPRADRDPRLQANRSESAAQFLVAETARRPGEITVVAIGPMTNLALALQLDSAFARNVKEAVVMAGSATTYAQNITTVGDFNVYADPEAMDTVLRSGMKVRMVGIDQTSQCILSRTDAAVLARSGDPFGQWAADCATAWIDYLHRAFPNREEHRNGCFLHDPLVLAAVIDPSICRWEEAHVTVELESELARGLVIADRGLALRPAEASNGLVATRTDVPRFRALFLERIGAGG